MILLSLQCLLLFAFGIALFFLWRAAEPAERWLKWIVAAGFLGRAVVGQALFWISWMRLPLLRSLQMGNGYWIFAQDTTFYFPQAVAAAGKGLRAILYYDRGGASVTYIQFLASMIALVGGVTSAGILLNLFCYLGTIALLVRWSRAQPQTRTAAAVAIAAISLTPSLVLWSLQPLKDSLFQLLFVAFVVICATWQRSWLAAGGWRTRIAAAALIIAVLYLLAGIRWYFAGALIAATSLFLLLVAFASSQRKRVSLSAAVVMIVVLAQTLVLSAKPYMPPSLVALLTLRGAAAKAGQVPRSMVAALERARHGFDATPASTVIKSGRQTTTTVAVPVPNPPPPSTTSAAVATPLPPPPTPHPPSRLERLLVGGAALVIPSILGERLGLFDIGGGRGLLWFADLDTLIFDFALVYAVWAIFAARAVLPWRKPLTWLVLLTALIIAAPLAYSISNFGTLFRLREMIFLGLLLAPIGAAAESRPSEGR